MTIETKSQFAKRINRVPSYVTELISHGRIVLTQDGKRVEVEASLQRMAETASGGNPAVAQRHEAARANKDDQSLNMQDGNRAKFKSMVLHYENQTIKIEMMLRRGLRFEISDLKKEAQSIGNIMRASVERLIDQTAPRLSVCKSRAEREKILKLEIKLLQRVIKSEFPRAMRRMQKGQQKI